MGDDPKPDKGKDDEHGHKDEHKDDDKGGQDQTADLLRVTVPAAEYVRYAAEDIAAWAGRDVNVRVDLSACGASPITLPARITSVQLPENRKSVTLWLAIRGTK